MIYSSEKVFESTAAVRAFHVFSSTWIPRKGEKLTCHHEENSAFDIYPIKNVTESNQIVDHLPREISPITNFLLDCGTKFRFTLTSTNYCRSPLVQGGLEIPCKLPATVKIDMILGRYKELVRELYCKPKEVRGSFLALTTGAVPEPSKVPLEKSKHKQSKCRNQQDSMI